jgi:hypothetical protein
MAYLFGTGTADHIVVSGLTPWTTRMTVFARFSLAAVTTTQRQIWSVAGSIGTVLDFAPGATNQVRFAYQDAAGVTQAVTWTSGFAAGVIHTLVGTIDLTLSSDQVKLYADEDPTPKAALTSPLGPLTAATAYRLGGDGGAASLDGILYEVAYWADSALSGASAAQLGAPDARVDGMPSAYWTLVNDARARWPNFGGPDGTVIGATLVAHAGTNRWPWPRRHSSVGL